MLSFVYNYFILFSLIYFTLKINDYYLDLNKIVFVLCLFYHLFLTIIYINIFPTGDWESVFYYEGFRGNHSSATFFSTNLVMNIITSMQKFLFLKNINIILVFSLISFFGIVLFIKNLVKLGLNKKYASLLLFLPSIHFWTGIPGKDSLILFSLSCFFHLYLDRKLFLSLIFIFIVFLLRPHIGLIFFISFFIAEMISLKSFNKKIIIFVFTCLIIFCVLYFSRTNSYFFNEKNLLSENILLKIFNQLHIMSQKYSDSTSSYVSRDIITNVFNYILFPIEFIFKKKSITINFLIVLEIFSFIFIIFLFMKNKTNVIVEKKLIYFLIISISLFLLILPQTFFNYGLNVRQKWMILPFLIYLSFLLKNLFVKINKI